MKGVEVRYPRVCDKDTLQEIGRAHPISLSVTENAEPLSTAQMSVLTTDILLSPGQFVEICDAYGSVGYYRIMHLSQSHKRGITQNAELEHAIVTLSDGVINGEADFAQGAQNALTVLQNLLNRQPKLYWEIWNDTETAADIAYLTSQTPAFYFEDEDLLQAVLDFMAQLPDEMQLVFDMSTFPWKLIPQRIPTEPTCEARISRNIEQLTIQYDYEQVCTRIYPKGSGSGEGTVTIIGATENPGGLLYIDSDTQGTWGIICKLWSDSEAQDPNTLYTKAKKQLEKVKNPVLSVTMDGQDLAVLTGESLDRFKAGQVIRLVIPEDGVNIAARILTKTTGNLISEPTKVSLTIGTADRRKASKQKSKGGGGGGGGGRTTTETFTLVGSKTMGVDYFSFGSFNLGSEWKSVKSVSAKLEYITISGAPDFDLYADGKYVQHIAGDASLTLTSYLRYSGGEIARGNHYLTARNADDPDASYSIRITVTVKGVKSQTSQTEE